MSNRSTYLPRATVDPEDSTVVHEVEAVSAPSSSARLSFLVVVCTAFLAMFLPVAWRGPLILPLLVAEAHMFRRSPELWRRSVFWMLFFAGFALDLPWPLTFIAPLLAYPLLCRVWSRARPTRRWLARGGFSGAAVAWMIPTIVLSSGALFGWVLLLRPDLSDVVPLIPRGGLAGVIAGGIAFSVCNALWEELILKGILWHGLEALFARGWAINVVQALFFGVIHYGGFPRGVVGAVMAGVYGFAIGLIRERAGGLLAPVVTHFFADATIFVILYLLSIGVVAT
jgi:hypothetical protein